jgi:hypothetical protein
MEPRIMLAALGLPILLSVLPAAAQTAPPIAAVLCEPRARLVARLAAQGGAQPVGQGLRDPSTMLEVWTTPQGRWTLVQADATGIACILAMGEGWETALPPARDPA